MYKKNKTRSGLLCTGQLLLFYIVWTAGDGTALWTLSCTITHTEANQSLYVLSGYIMQQPSNKTFLFQCVKYIPLCQEELLAFIIFCKERFKVQSTNYLFLSTIPTWYWKQPLFLFLQTKLFFTHVCKNNGWKKIIPTAIGFFCASHLSSVVPDS